MSLPFLRLGGVLALSGLVGCAAPERQAAWPEPRPLGADVPAYRPALEPPGAVSMPQATRDPGGVLQLPQAQALSHGQSLPVAGQDNVTACTPWLRTGRGGRLTTVALRC